MEKYYFIEAQIPLHVEDQIDQKAHGEFGCSGIEEFSIEEAKVDEILGERSYSGGDVPESVIAEVEATLKSEGVTKKYIFPNSSACTTFLDFLRNKFDIKSVLKEEEIKDWDQEWKKNYHPILVGPQLEIIPQWEKNSYQSNTQKQIYIYPGRGFGTGSHETTFLCLKLMLEVVGDDKKIGTCLDFGCGSGILGLAYRLFDPESDIDLYDIDPEALENTVQNIELNKLDESSFKLLLPKDRNQIDRKYSLVFANILQNVLIFESEYLAHCLDGGGSLILSGLLTGQEEEVINRISKIRPEVEFIKTVSQGDWVAVLMGIK